MVKVINAHQREGKNGSFVSLELQGDIVMIQSQATGRFYATAKCCFVFSTFDLMTAQSLIGKEIQGTIERVESDPYDFVIKETGETIKLAHSYAYVPFAGATPQYEPQTNALQHA
jgi:hypothetical protein